MPGSKSRALSAKNMNKRLDNSFGQFSVGQGFLKESLMTTSTKRHPNPICEYSVEDILFTIVGKKTKGKTRICWAALFGPCVVSGTPYVTVVT